MTVFSAPDYPQFVPADAPRYNNLAAVAVLAAPDYDAPTMTQFAAVQPRPAAEPYRPHHGVCCQLAYSLGYACTGFGGYCTW